MGPGDPAYLTSKVRDQLSSADVIAGFETPLDILQEEFDARLEILTYENQQSEIERIYRDTGPEDRVVVCCWGDPGVSDKEFIDRWREVGFTIHRIPGISSIQVACSRAHLPFERTLFITFHKRGDLTEDRDEFVRHVRDGKRHVIALPHPWEFMPSDMAAHLIDHGVSTKRSVTVLEELTLPGEDIRSYSVEELSSTNRTFSDLTIVIVHRL